ncbi:hypothetical protein [Agromyces soli]|uniref:Glycosyltransferase n=1 Tax=Agromyces soli TaxID=659012 RepID=A0ABY4ASQ1_9MICO|nr:hypothetical protein [Agromyces soli]UOE26030.1 hypothetical protein MTP13_17235 [Agromyces soli]
MTRPERDPAVTHLFDAAGVARTLTTAGRSSGRRWWHLDARDLSRDAQLVPRVAGAAAWHGRRVAYELRSDLIHLHYGRRVKYLELWPRRPYVLHFHGTDIRHHFHQPYAHDVMQAAADGAAAVLYSTPDLAEHARAARSDAVYFANPIDVSALPEWRPAKTPLVVFPSRWDASKDAERQLAIAAALREALPHVRLEGLDWGDSAARAAELGVRLRPRTAKPEYLRWLAGAHAAVGQPAGVLAISELEVLGIGVPLVMAPHPSSPSDVPVTRAALPAETVAAVESILADPEAASAAAAGRNWVSAHHDVPGRVAALRALYRGIGAE